MEPYTLYHYTDQAGLLGIIESKTIWATHTQFLNDTKEFIHAVDIINDEIMRLSRKQNRTPYYNFMQTLLYGAEKTNVCISSFSASHDLLSQWRSYGSATSGFALGFCYRKLKSVANSLDWQLVPCEYNEETQRSEIRQKVESYLDELLERLQMLSKGSDTFDRESANLETPLDFLMYVLTNAPRFKHKSFKSEEEWRLISKPISGRDLKFRKGNSMLVPYAEFPLAKSFPNLSLCLHKIVIGPTPNPMESKLSLQKMLQANSLDDVSVELSSVPYRSW